MGIYFRYFLRTFFINWVFHSSGYHFSVERFLYITYYLQSKFLQRCAIQNLHQHGIIMVESSFPVTHKLQYSTIVRVVAWNQIFIILWVLTIVFFEVSILTYYWARSHVWYLIHLWKEVVHYLQLYCRADMKAKTWKWTHSWNVVAVYIRPQFVLGLCNICVAYNIKQHPSVQLCVSKSQGRVTVTVQPCKMIILCNLLQSSSYFPSIFILIFFIFIHSLRF